MTVCRAYIECVTLEQAAAQISPSAVVKLDPERKDGWCAPMERKGG